MGSFNETCALSNFNIGPGDPVRQLFLTQNPYIVCDEYNAYRGCHHSDQWFVRTPPIKGVYEDYGACKFEEGPITDLIVSCFRDDVVERPYGFNQYHAHDITKTKDISHFISAAEQGRLLVFDAYFDEYQRSHVVLPEGVPTWERLHAEFKEAGLPIQSEVENFKGYNAQSIELGIVAVTFNDYSSEVKKLNDVITLLLPKYDCKLVYTHEESKYDPCLLVMQKGALENPSLITSLRNNQVKQISMTHPSIIRMGKTRTLPVLAVMIREDVWQKYCTVDDKDDKYAFRKLNSPDGVYVKLKQKFEKLEAMPKDVTRMSVKEQIAWFRVKRECCDVGREFFVDLPFQTGVGTHIKKAIEIKDFAGKEELLRSCAELSRIECVMGRLKQPWYIPPMGGQEGNWALRTALFSNLFELSQSILREEMKERAKWD
jgi:hypothetical protein